MDRVYSDIEYLSTGFTADDLRDCFGEKYMNLPIGEREFFEWLLMGGLGSYKTVMEKGDNAMRLTVNFGDVVVRFTVKKQTPSCMEFHTWFSLKRMGEGDNLMVRLDEMGYVKWEKSLDDLDLASDYMKRISKKDAKRCLWGITEYINARESIRK
ncbi:MAG: hypothetical protein LUD47_03300 [Clostridia bacterium]|nr:hypothetical protein [Clostridia bacterium]